MSAVTIAVTRRDIRLGRRTSCGDCPVALAVARALHLEWISVGPAEMDIGQDGSLVEVSTPETARRFIRDFDQGRPVSPFSFDLDVPDDLTAGGA